MRKLVVLLSLCALLPFAFAACGGDDDEDETTPAATEETTPEAEGGGAGGGAGGTVDVAADPTGQLAFEQQSLEAPAGTVTFNFTNESATPHDFIVEDETGNDLGGTEVITGDSTSVDIDLEPGEYTFYCSVDAHREAGMEGPLTVE